MAANAGVNAWAEKPGEDRITENELFLDCFIEDAVKTALIMSGSQEGNYTISNLIPIYDFETGKSNGQKKALIISGNRVFAELDIWTDGDQYYSSFCETENNPVDPFINGNDALCYGVYQDSLWLCVNNTSFYHADSFIEVEAPANIECLSLPIEVEQNIKLDANDPQACAIDDKIVLSVTHQANDKSPGATDWNLCWAACIAMKVNYLKNTQYTAISLYNYLIQNNMDYDGSGDCVKKAYKSFGIDIEFYGNAQNQYLWNMLENNQPFDVAIKGERSDGKTEYHQVLVCGMAKGSTGIAYRFDCPNSKAKKVVQISGDAGTLMKSMFTSLPYTDTWSYKQAGETIDFNNVYRTFATPVS